MTEQLSMEEFDRLLRKAAPLLSPTAVASRVEGSRRRSPVELTVFQGYPAGTKFTDENWRGWSNLILNAISIMGEPGYALPELLVSDFSATAALPATKGPPEINDTDRPMIRMLQQLQRAGQINLCTSTSRFVVTPEGKEFLQRTEAAEG